MRKTLALALAAGMAATFAMTVPCALAQPESSTQPADAAKRELTDAEKKALAEAAAKMSQDAGKQMGDATAAMMNPAAPKEIPVPTDLPVIETKEVDGVTIEELKMGTGYEVKPGGAVVAHYHGTLKADPTKVFDSSFKRGEPAAFPLSGVIQGWQKGVPGMKIGGIRRLTIPAALAYGAQGAGPDIPPNSDLVFIIQLEDALQIEDVTVGTGDEVGSRAIAATSFTMKTADGKEVDSASKDNFFIWVPGENNGVMSGIEGMKVGGKRKLSIPAAFNVTPPGAPNPKNRPSNVAVTVEIDLLGVKNLMPVQPRR